MNDYSATGKRSLALILVAVLLSICLASSLAANVALGGWALSNRDEAQAAQERVAELEAQVWQLEQSVQQGQERITALEAEVERLEQEQRLCENDGGDSERPLDPANAALMDATEEQMIALRGLQPLRSVERALMTRDELRAWIIRDLEENYSPEEARDYALTLAAFDLLDPDVDLYDLFVRLYTEQIAGFYDPETEELYVIAESGPMGPLEHSTYSHEYVHALQDQHFDLEALGLRDNADEEYDSEYLSAIQALVEGDASLAQQQFVSEYYTTEELLDLLEEVNAIETPVFDAAPAVIRDQLMFPYSYGLMFVQALYDEGGWAAIDAAYADPPRSTEHILHPERYRAGDMPQLVSLPPLTDTLGTGWRQADEDIFGEYMTRYYLDQQISGADARAAAEGWGGDRYAVYHRQSDGALAMILRTVWDTPADVEEFVDAYVAYAERRFGHAADSTAGGRMCWSGARDHLCLTWGPSNTLIVLGPDTAVVEAVLRLF